MPHKTKLTICSAMTAADRSRLIIQQRHAWTKTFVCLHGLPLYQEYVVFVRLRRERPRALPICLPMRQRWREYARNIDLAYSGSICDSGT